VRGAIISAVRLGVVRRVRTVDVAVDFPVGWEVGAGAEFCWERRVMCSEGWRMGPLNAFKEGEPGCEAAREL
jgi:hypothetical protein